MSNIRFFPVRKIHNTLCRKENWSIGTISARRIYRRNLHLYPNKLTMLQAYRISFGLISNYG